MSTTLRFWKQFNVFEIFVVYTVCSFGHDVYNLPVASKEITQGVVVPEDSILGGVDYCKLTHFQGNIIIFTTGRTGTRRHTTVLRGRSSKVLHLGDPSSEVFTPRPQGWPEQWNVYKAKTWRVTFICSDFHNTWIFLG